MKFMRQGSRRHRRGQAHLRGPRGRSHDQQRTSGLNKRYSCSVVMDMNVKRIGIYLVPILSFCAFGREPRCCSGMLASAILQCNLGKRL
jgi:hypothetical protein